jgi:adenosine deaminase
MEPLDTQRGARELAELHCHLGQSVEPHILWAIAHEQGIKLPSKSYEEFCDFISLRKTHVTWDDYHALFHWTELIQSSPVAMERAVYEVVSGAYRVSGITLLELSFNPMFRNRSGERDLDQIILGALRGMERALVEFPAVRSGLIFLLDRRLSRETNEIIVRKAIKYSRRGVVGIDIAGPAAEGFSYGDYAGLYREARDAGLKTTVHTGEDGTADEMRRVIEALPLDRINHGIRAYTDPDLMATLVKKNLTLCLCPTSNLSVGFVRDAAHLREIVGAFRAAGVKFCFNTDNPAMLRTTLPKELAFIRDNGILDEAQISQTIRSAFEASFVNLSKKENLYL